MRWVACRKWPLNLNPNPSPYHPNPNTHANVYPILALTPSLTLNLTLTPTQVAHLLMERLSNGHVGVAYGEVGARRMLEADGIFRISGEASTAYHALLTMP